MDKKFMEKTTFSEICKMMRDGNPEDSSFIKNTLELGVVFLPALISPQTALLDSLSSGMDLLAVVKTIKNVGISIKNYFTGRQTDFVSRYERVQAAQVLLVFSAYFDTMKMYLPDESRIIALSNGEKIAITEESLKKYTEWVAKKYADSSVKLPKNIMDYGLDLPAPLESNEQFNNRLKKFYDLLNDQFIEFYNKLSFFETLSGLQKDCFMSTLRQIPQKSVENYRCQCFALEAEVIDFRIWANKQEHYEIKDKIDVGFEQLASRFYELLQTRSVRGSQTISNYAKINQQYIDDNLIKTTEIDVAYLTDVSFPSKKMIFVPQRFKALQYTNEMLIENEKTWIAQEIKDEIGLFIANTLRHSVTGKMPILILGDPGAGKTLLSHMLGAQILSCEYHVIIIRLRDIVAENTIIQQINEQIEHDFANQCSWDEIVKESSSTPLLLIFDGYDELLQASGKTYSDYISKIVDFQNAQQNIYGVQVKCILTSRIALIDKARIPKGTTIIKLLEFDEERIEKWIDIWNETNSSYFEMHNIQPFVIEAGSKVYELAKQPLLLLLLAIYDSNDNSLKKNAELTGAQLYARLIKDFIEREQRKNTKFLDCTKEEQKKIIEYELQKISIAALGMYNRNVLYVRDVDLDRDLKYLLPDANRRDALNTEYGRLKKSDRVLGSFFFIHRSDAKSSTRHGDEKVVAYEFLHNTFGEFLTAYFVVNELFKNVDQIIYLLKGNRMADWSLSLSRGWCLSLAYAPLSSRPIVIKMIREWACEYFNEKLADGDNDKVHLAMMHILETEIANIISGEDILALDKVLSENGNPYEKRERLVHLACYSLNLVILETIVCKQKEEVYYCSSEIWNKLTCLWRYAFQEKELLSFSSLFTTNKLRNEKNEEKYYLRYSPNEEDYGTQLLRLERISNAVGDIKSESLISAILGDGNIYKVLEMLECSDFDIMGTYLCNRLLRALDEGAINISDVVIALKSFTRLRTQDLNFKNLLLYYFLVNCLLKSGRIKPESIDVVYCFEPGLRFFGNSNSSYFDMGQHEYIKTVLIDAFCSVIHQLPLYSIIYLRGSKDYFSCLDIDLQLRIVDTILGIEQSEKIAKGTTLEFCRTIQFDSVIEHYYRSDNMDKMDFNKLGLIIDILSAVPIDAENIELFIRESLLIFERLCLNNNIQAQILKIRLCKLANDYGISRRYVRDIWTPYISIKAVFEYSPDIVYDICCVIDKFDILEYGFENDLRWIIRTHEQDLSVKLYRKIKQLLSDTSS